MEKGKKTNSFLYDLYMRMKEKTRSGEEAGNEISTPDQIMEEKQEHLSDGATEDKKEEIQAPESDENMNSLYSLYSFIYGTSEGEKNVPDLNEFSKMVLSSVIDSPYYLQYEPEIRKFVEELGTEAERQEQSYRKMQSEYMREKKRYEAAVRDVEVSRRAVESLRQTSAESGIIDQAVQRQNVAENILDSTQKPEMPSVIDSAVYTKITRDGLHAFCCLFPPHFGGADTDKERILKALKEKYVTYGVKEAQIEDLASRKCYLQIFQAAEGIPPIHGKNGEVIDKVSRNNEIVIQQGEDGKADYKNLNQIQNVMAGDVLCEFIEAEKGTPGMNVSGAVINAEDGAPPRIPNGKNTALSADGKQLTASENGCVKFHNECFHVEKVYVVKGNIDYGEGNIDFSGDVVIYGDVLNGFSVKAKGSVSVQGMVEDAEIIAGGDIEIAKGMNGNRHGQLDAGGSVKASFLENCTVYAGESIHTNSIISCDIFCEGTVYVEGTRGVIIGGTITSFRSVEARIIGSKSNRETEIVLGEMPRLVTKRQEAQEEMKGTMSVLDKLGKNISFLEGFKTSLPPEKEEILKQLKQQQDLYEEKKCDLTKTLDRLNNRTLDYDECTVKANMIFPPTRIQIGTDSFTVGTVISKCRVFKGEEGIAIGTL